MSHRSASNRNLNKVDEDTENLVRGFIRNIQESMLLIIPDPIIMIVLSFYYLGEYFKDFNKSIFGCVDKDCQILKCVSTNSPWSSIYGNVIASSDKSEKYIWKLRFNKLNSGQIGISSNYDVNERFFFNKKSYNYSFYSDGMKVSRYDYNDYCDKQGVVTRYKQGDVITMILDCELKQLSFHKNDEDLGVAFDNIGCGQDIKYKMAIYMYHKHEEVELLDFTSM